MQRGKRGLSTIIVTLILILVSLVAVGIIWVVVRNIIQTGTEGVGLSQFSLNAKILDVSIDNSSNNISLTVKRNAGEGELEGISFVFSSDGNNEVITRTVLLKELEQMKFNFHLINTSVSDLISVSIIPLIKQDRKQIFGIALDKYNLGKNQNAQPGQTACTPTNCSILGYVCGTWNNGTCAGSLNCGTCTGGQSCNTSGRCVSSCVPLVSNYCSTMGYVCGYWGNNSCSGNLSCGTCGTGDNCVGGNCVPVSGALCEPNTYYIDFIGGNDNNNGTCNNSAWKHAPGDDNAGGIADSTALIPGSIVKFKGGVIYNGMIHLDWSGTSGNPITYTNYSGSRAIIDGTGLNNALFDWSRNPLGYANWITVENLEIRNYWNYGIAINGSNIIVQNCNIHTGLSGGGNEPLIVTRGDYNKILYNEIHDSNWNCVNVQNANYNEIAYNNIYDCPDHGGINIISNTVTYFGMMTGNDIHHNFVHDIGQGAIYTRYQQNNKIYNNILDLGPESSSHVNIYFSNGGAGGPTSYTANTEIYNNLILGGRWSIFNDAANNIIIKNNIFKDPANNVFISMYSTTNGHILDYNLYNGTGVWRIGGSEYSTLASLPSPYEDNGLMGNPGFVNEAGNDFRYTAASNAINRGTDLLSRGITNDYAGVSRPQGLAWDIGAYEYA